MATGAGTVGGGGVDSSLSTVAGIDQFHRSLDSNGVGAGKCRASIPRRKKHGQRRLFSVRRRRKTEDGRRKTDGTCRQVYSTNTDFSLFSLPSSLLSSLPSSFCSLHFLLFLLSSPPFLFLFSFSSLSLPIGQVPPSLDWVFEPLRERSGVVLFVQPSIVQPTRRRLVSRHSHQ